LLPEPFYNLEGQVAIDLPGARAVFTTSSWGDVRETATQIGDRLGVVPARPRQVHGNVVVTVEAEQPTVVIDAEADAVITARPGIAPMVLTADCIPIVIAAPGIVASVHAGWRGLDSGVIASAVGAMRRAAGVADRASALALSCAIGPAAGACCYEVGPELHERFAAFSAGRNLDLKAIARAQLEDAGIATIHDVGICTICGTDPEMYSYRRDGVEAGRQALLAWLT
jgi:polyphenol oxidase